MSQQQNQTNHCERYNPYEHLKQSLKEDGLPVYKPFIKGGVIAVGKDDRIIMVPEVHLDANTYRDWFHTEYPDGRTEIIRHTEPPTVTSEGKVIYFQEVFEVKFYMESTSEIPKTSGWGRAAYVEGNEYDEVGTAISIAFKNGMRNMGFAVDLDMEIIQENLPKYIETTLPGKHAEFKLVDSNPLPEKSSVENAPTNDQTASQTSIPREAPSQTGNNSNMDVFSFLENKEMCEKETTETVAAPVHSQPEEPAKTDIIDTEETVISPSNVLFYAIDPQDSLAKFNGKTLGEILQINKSIIMMICRETFKWEGRLPEHVYMAAKKLV